MIPGEANSRREESYGVEELEEKRRRAIALREGTSLDVGREETHTRRTKRKGRKLASAGRAHPSSRRQGQTGQSYDRALRGQTKERRSSFKSYKEGDPHFPTTPAL